jgi:hypothetical protein
MEAVEAVETDLPDTSGPIRPPERPEACAMYGFFSDPAPASRPDPEPRKPVQAKRRRRWRHRTSPEWNLHLECTGTDIAPRFLAESPSVATLAVEDLCWQAAIDDWKRRRPHRWRSRARADWEAEGKLLSAEADRLRELAVEMLQEL